MRKFSSITSMCIPIEIENIDTDQIVPARFLKITTREGFGKYLFYDWRFDKNGKPKNNPYFHELNHESIKILITGNNFGCGSSREHAVWALQDFGFEAVISSSFGDIFYNNSLKNGLLPVTVKPFELNQLFRIIEEKPETKITVDLENQSVIILRASPDVTSGRVEKSTSNSPRQARTIIYQFPLDQFRKSCLLKGIDELGYIFSMKKKIQEFERFHKNFLSV